MSAISNIVGSASTPATTASVQPLPSNMVNKTSFQMETQYMQQQSQIFVFTTELANKAAESYLSGNSPSIIAYHCAQPGTKSFLEKYPLKVQQFNRQNPAAWLNSLAQMKQSGGRQIKNSGNQYSAPHNLRFPGPSGDVSAPCTGACNMHGPGMCSAPCGSSPWSNSCAPGMPSIPNDICSQSWSQQSGPGMSLSSINHRFSGPGPQGLNVRQIVPTANPLMGCMESVNSNAGGGTFPNAALSTLHMNQGPGGPSSLTGVKVPDENLTPQQRQHREEQLTMIQKMQQLLFPEQQQLEQSQSRLGSNIGPAVGGIPPQSRFGHGDMCVQPGMDVSFSPHQPCMSEHEHSSSDMYMESQMVGQGYPQNYSPVPVSAQLEWQKLQNKFFEERHKKQVCNSASITDSSPGSQGQNEISAQQPLSQPHTPQQQSQGLNSPSPNLGLSPGTRMQGPPPPYHQTNRRTMPSPHPSSPNTSSLSLPSPRMASGLSSPADPSGQFPVPTPPGPRLSHHSPGPTTPAGSNSLHTTPLNSPKPLNTSGPGSNSGTHIRTPTTPSNTVSTPSVTPTSSCAPALSNSGPSTPASSCAANRKQSQSCTDIQDSNSVSIVASTSSEFASSVPTPNSIQGELFCHNMPSCTQSSEKQDHCSNRSGICQKEPSLMPVPSPQQIKYLNTFDGQELTIQKQPNTSVRELDISSNNPSSMVISGGSHSQLQNSDVTSFPNTPGSCPSALENGQDSLAGRYPSSAPASMEGGILHTVPSPDAAFPNTPGSCPSALENGQDSLVGPSSAPASIEGSIQRFTVPSPDATFPNTPGSCPSTLENSQDSLVGSSASASMEGGIQRFTVQSPQTPGYESGQKHITPISQIGDNSIQRFPVGQNPDLLKISGPSTVHNVLEENANKFPLSGSQSSVFGSSNNSNINLSHFPGSASEAMQRLRGPNPQVKIEMGHPCVLGSSPRMSCDNISQPSQFSNLGSKSVPPISAHTFPSPISSMTPQSSPCASHNYMDSSMSHSHLQNLQKMTPPFENMSGNKISSDVISPIVQCSNSSVNSSIMSIPPYGGTGSLTSSQVGPPQRMPHFDPIASMAAMSESTVPMVSAPGNTQMHPNITSNMTNLQVAGSSGNNNQSNVNFNTSLQPMQNLPSTVACSMSSQNQFSMHNQMTHNAGCCPQTVNNTHMNATMPIQQLNMQNVVTTSYNVNAQGPIMNPHSIHPNCQGSGANTISCSVTTNHPIMHTSVTTRTNSNMAMPGPRHGPPNFPGQSLVQRNTPGAGSPSMIGRGAPFNSTSVQVRANAPNTIQYFPARQQNASLSNRPPTLEFLQRYAVPLTNLDSKLPTHNLQYFPNNGGSNPPTIHNNVGLTQCSGTVAPSMMNSQRPVNMLMGPMMRGANSTAPHPSGQIFPVGSGLPGTESSMYGRSPCPSMNNQMIAMGGGQGVGMFPNKQMPLPMGGMAPDATQPLPPSMVQSFNYKQAPFHGPTTADPNYAVQFLNFQQQLYATNTRGSPNSSQASLSGPRFFGPK